ncbi:MAG: ArsA family ATPase [Solirubrobacteraceae bacterium]
MSVARLLSDKRICVCCGSGGVGKTTTSAAIALGMAATGAKVAVVTIDPARRLANALGCGELDNEPRRVAPERLAAGGAPVRGELWAMMLDPKRTFDELIERVAGDPVRAREIKANRIYSELSTAVSGSQEFTAVAKLHELARDGDFDLLVLDTPPSRNAVDFLEAPGRLTSFLEGRALRAFVKPTGLGMRVLGLGAAPLLGALRRVTGVDLVGDMATFFALLGGMTDEFTERAAAVQRLLRDESTAFLLVCSAREEAIEEAIWFHRTLQRGGLPFAGAIVNRVHAQRRFSDSSGETAAWLAAQLGEDLAGRVNEGVDEHRRLARRDARSLARLRAQLGDSALIALPHLNGDVHDIEGLARVQEVLFAAGRGPRPRPPAPVSA